MRTPNQSMTETHRQIYFIGKFQPSVCMPLVRLGICHSNILDENDDNAGKNEDNAMKWLWG
jgi:hypothetical protein